MKIKFRYLSLVQAVLLTALSAALFWPGGMSPDSLNQYEQSLSWKFFDGNPVMMSLIWIVTNKIVQGGGGLLLLQLFIYWLGIIITVRFLLGIKAFLPSILLTLLLGLWPPLFFLMATLWKDCMMSAFFIMAVGLTAAYTQTKSTRLFWAALVFYFLGIAVRINSLPAAFPLVAALVASTGFFSQMAPFRRGTWAILTAGIISLSMFLSVMGITRLVRAETSHLWVVTAIFDIAGVIKQSNYDPSHEDLPMSTRQVTRDEIQRLYNPRTVSPLIFEDCNGHTPCVHWLFFQYDDQDRLFRLMTKWKEMIVDYPGPYLAHRLQYFKELVGITEAAVWCPFYFAVDKNQWGFTFPKSPKFIQMEHNLEALATSILYKVWIYLCTLLVTLAFARVVFKNSPNRYILIALSLSGLFYTTTFFFLGVSADFRYSHWPIVCSVLICTYGLLSLVRDQYFRLSNRFLRKPSPITS